MLWTLSTDTYYSGTPKIRAHCLHMPENYSHLRSYSRISGFWYWNAFVSSPSMTRLLWTHLMTSDKTRQLKTPSKEKITDTGVSHRGSPCIRRPHGRSTTQPHTYGSGWFPCFNMWTIWWWCPSEHLHPYSLPWAVGCGPLFGCSVRCNNTCLCLWNTGYNPRYVNVIRSENDGW